MSFQRPIQLVYISIRFVYTETCSGRQCLATHSFDWFVNKSKQIANIVCKYADVSKSS